MRAARRPKPTFFATPAQLRAWFKANHRNADELWVGFYKKDSGRPSITWPESVDEALCVGWIDGIRKSLGDVSYVIRFTPRKPRSTWSAVNIRRVEALRARGAMRPAGLAAFAALEKGRSGTYSYEQRTVELAERYAKIMKRNRVAWVFFQAQAPWYRKAIGWWVVSAKQEATRLKRLAILTEHSEAGRLHPQITKWKKAK